MNQDTDICLKTKKLALISIPQWDVVPPTQRLIQNGLPLEVLQDEIDTLNKKSIENTPSLSSCLWTGLVIFIVLALICAGLIITVRNRIFNFEQRTMESICLAMSMLTLTGGIGYAVGIMLWRAKQITKGFEATCQYIEHDLNKKYQPNGIQWRVIYDPMLLSDTHRPNPCITPGFVRYIIVSCGASKQTNV